MRTINIEPRISNIGLKFIACILVQAFIVFNVTWAGNAGALERYDNGLRATLSPQIMISSSSLRLLFSNRHDRMSKISSERDSFLKLRFGKERFSVRGGKVLYPDGAAAISLSGGRGSGQNPARPELVIKFKRIAASVLTVMFFGFQCVVAYAAAGFSRWQPGLFYRPAMMEQPGGRENGEIESLSSFETAAVENKVENPDFEQGYQGWDNLWGEPAMLVPVNHTPGGGYAMAKSIGANDQQDYWSQLYQDIPFIAGKPLYVSIYAKSTFSPLGTSRGGLMVEFFNNNGQVLKSIVSKSSVGGTMNWRLLEVNYAAAPAGTVKVRISGTLWTARGDPRVTGKVFFDDALLVQEYRPLIAQTKLNNPGMENGLMDWQSSGIPAGISGTVMYSGKYSMMSKINSVGTQDFWSQEYQEVVCSAGKIVTASVYVKSGFKVTAQAKAGLLIEFLSATGKVLKTAQKNLAGKNAWRRLALKLIAPAKTVRVRYSLYAYAPKGNTASVGGKAYFDQAGLTIKASTASSSAEGQSTVKADNHAAAIMNPPEFVEGLVQVTGMVRVHNAGAGADTFVIYLETTDGIVELTNEYRGDAGNPLWQELINAEGRIVTLSAELMASSEDNGVIIPAKLIAGLSGSLQHRGDTEQVLFNGAENMLVPLSLTHLSRGCVENLGCSI